MKKINQIALLLSITILALACNPKEQQKAGHTQHDHGSPTNEPSHKTNPGLKADAPGSVVLKDPDLDALHQQYQLLTKALVVEDVKSVKTAALAIEAGARAIKGTGSMATAAAKISSTSDLKTQRMAFSTLNEAFIALLKDSGLDRGKLYVAHCPMALDDQGASWVSYTREIRNPYFGDSMLTCGSITETL